VLPVADVLGKHPEALCPGIRGPIDFHRCMKSTLAAVGRGKPYSQPGIMAFALGGMEAVQTLRRKSVSPAEGLLATSEVCLDMLKQVAVWKPDAPAKTELEKDELEAIRRIEALTARKTGYGLMEQAHKILEKANGAVPALQKWKELQEKDLAALEKSWQFKGKASYEALRGEDRALDARLAELAKKHGPRSVFRR
jgi:hypothetical protein